MTIPTEPQPAGHPASTVLILAAAMGGGHLGAATELARRLQDSGYGTQIVDLLSLMKLGYGRTITAIYHAQLRFAPWSYQAIYSLWRNHRGLVSAANGADTRMARRNLLEVVARTDPFAIVSTYNLGSQVLGDLKADGSLTMPVYSFVTDFGVHPYWIHDAIDGYLTVHESSQRAVATQSNAPTVVCGPLVSSRFGKPTDRDATRTSLGLTDGATAALVVAGAWGVGEVEATVADLRKLEGCTPIVVCGNNARLARRLRRSGHRANTILGFTDAMPSLMTATDVLVENAGGLTCFEAFASGLPVVTYRPIPAHGIDNANAMADAGVTTFAHTTGELAQALDDLGPCGTERSQRIAAAHRVIRPDATAKILNLIDPSLPDGRQSTADAG